MHNIQPAETIGNHVGLWSDTADALVRRPLDRFSYTLCLKKVPTFKLSLTLSNLHRF